MLENRKINIWSYNVETIIAEKFEAIIKRSVLGTRIRDYYDIYMLIKTQQKNIENQILKDAIYSTAEHRKSIEIIKTWENVVNELEKSDIMKQHWKKYQSDNFYAEDINYEDLIKCLKDIGKLV